MRKLSVLPFILIIFLGGACASGTGGKATQEHRSSTSQRATTSSPAPTGSTATPTRSRATAPPSQTTPVRSRTPHRVARPVSPASVVRSYIAAINRADYAAAFRIIAPAIGGSYSGYAAGYAGTDHDVLTIDAISGNAVHVDLIAYQTDGTHKHYQGTYWVRGSHIVDTHIEQLSAPTPTTAAPDLCGAADNPWGYNFCGGKQITAPPADFCTYFSCIGNFPNGVGYVVQCRDGEFSRSGGRPGVCSYHGGEGLTLYAP